MMAIPSLRHVKHFQTARRSTEPPPPPPPPPPPLPPPAPPPTFSPSEQVVTTSGPLPSTTLAPNPTSELITSADTTNLDLLQEDTKPSPNKAAPGGGTKTNKPQNHACEECGKNFLTAFQLNKHKLGHSKVRSSEELFHNFCKCFYPFYLLKMVWAISRS